MHIEHLHIEKAENQFITPWILYLLHVYLSYKKNFTTRLKWKSFFYFLKYFLFFITHAHTHTKNVSNTRQYLIYLVTTCMMMMVVIYETYEIWGEIVIQREVLFLLLCFRFKKRRKFMIHFFLFWKIVFLQHPRDNTKCFMWLSSFSYTFNYVICLTLNVLWLDFYLSLVCNNFFFLSMFDR